MSDTEFTNRTALVSGAAGGIGGAVATALAAHGATVAAVDRDEAGVATVAEKLTAEGHRAAGFTADVRDSAAVDEVVEQVERTLGPIEILVSCAGVLRCAPIVELSDEDWNETFAVNTTGAFHLVRAVARRMVGRRSGSIVTVASNSATVPRAQMGAYAASKAATMMLTKCLGVELADAGIRCNIVSPGSTDTAMQRQMWHEGIGRDSVIDGDMTKYRLGIPLRRIADPADIADAVTFLASDRARHITMHDLCVDGGATLGA
jgi:2,3-dihydro-2,3-dihydroxybenzoate dehydrogenase